MQTFNFNFGAFEVTLQGLQFSLKSCFLFSGFRNLLCEKVLEVTALLVVQVDVKFGIQR